jgi:hypothetical protein
MFSDVSLGVYFDCLSRKGPSSSAFMKRHHLITFHLVLSTFLLPFLLMIPFSGFMHLAAGGESVTSEKVFDLTAPVPEDASERDAFLEKAFADKGLDAGFERVVKKGERLVFFPLSRTHYEVQLTETGGEVFKVIPSLRRSMMELHKGHGPKLFRFFEMFFGIGLILMALSGVWMAILVPMYRGKLFWSFGIGALLFFAAAFL